MNFLKAFTFLIALALSYAGASLSAAAQAPDTAAENVQKRVEQLELQMEALQRELLKLKSELSANSSSAATAANAVSASTRPNPSTASTDSKPAQTTTAEKRVTGIDLGPVRATPYGTIYFNAFGNSGGTNNADDPLFATPTNQGNVSLSVRQTRLGLKLEGPTILHAKSRGQIEADFFGGFPAVGVGDNFGVVRLRLAFARLDWEKTSLEAGQDWMVFAPNNPVSIAAAAIPQMAAAGNAWARLPQLRLERRWPAAKFSGRAQCSRRAPAIHPQPPRHRSFCNQQPARRRVFRSSKVASPSIMRTGSARRRAAALASLASMAARA